MAKQRRLHLLSVKLNQKFFERVRAASKKRGYKSTSEFVRAALGHELALLKRRENRFKKARESIAANE